MYHRVVTDAELASQFIQPGMYVTAETFHRHVRFLREHFHVLSMRELLSLWREGPWSSAERYCVITFDDGWLDNYVHALPVLRQYGVPASIFLPTGFIGTARWFWPERLGWLGQRFPTLPPQHRAQVLASLRRRDAWLDEVANRLEAGDTDELIKCCKTAPQERIEELVNLLASEMDLRLPDERLLLNWREVEEISAAGISFGSHSVSHKILTTVSPTELHEEVHGSLAELRKRNINVAPVFCYPNGDHSPIVVRCVESAGYSAALTTDPGWEGRSDSHLFRLKRIGVHNDMTSTDALFAFHLAGYNNRARS
jgi:peptidoglycan/xylan/chitin deacetylase (PgdA/CDA1 family)